jgi:hypothetical protein
MQERPRANTAVYPALIERSRNEQGTLYRIVTGTAPALAA